MWNTSTFRIVAATAGAGLLSACADSTAPNASRFDGKRVEAGVAAVEKVAASSALSSVQMLARFGGDLGAASSQLASPELSPGLGQAVRVITQSAVDAGTFLVPVMRPSVLGKTFVYDATQKKYIISPTRTGAPANGVRFVLYDETPSGDPIVGREIGYADLTDEKRTSPNVASVKLVAVTGGITRLSYSFDLAVAGALPSISVQGYMVDGDDRLDFTVSAGSTMLVGGKATVQATITAPKQGFSVTAKLTGIAGQDLGDGDIDLTISSATDKIVVDAAVVSGNLDATFTVNGKLFARATGNPKSPDIRGEGGRALTEEELRGLGRIVDMSHAIFKFVEELVAPAGKLLLFALGLGG